MQQKINKHLVDVLVEQRKCARTSPIVWALQGFPTGKVDWIGDENLGETPEERFDAIVSWYRAHGEGIDACITEAIRRAHEEVGTVINQETSVPHSGGKHESA